ncbi:hypothetical protein LLG95_09175 [bacterium]|nr:hypothetical protein [bacterium]
MILGNVAMVAVDLNLTAKPPKEVVHVMSITPARSASNETTATTTPGWVIVQSDLTTSITTMLAGNLIEPRKDDRHKLNGRIEKLNAGYRATIQAYADYLRDEPGMTQHQAAERLRRIDEAWWDLLRNEYYGTNLYDTFQRDFQSTYEKTQVVRRINNVLELKLATDHQNWRWAAEICRYDRRIGGWPVEVYYLQKLGAPGKALIAQRTSERYWTALKSSVLSIGPDFHWPRMDE